MATLFTIFIFFLTLSILIIVHEYGHYRMAKWCGVKVLRFSLGFGKPFFTWRVGKDQTEFTLAPFLFGGYVKMLDSREKPVENKEDFSRDFSRKPLYKRALIVFAGPAANFLFAVVFLTISAMVGIQSYVPKIGQPLANSMLAQSGASDGDQVTGIVIGDAAYTQNINSAEELDQLLRDAVLRHQDVRLHITKVDGSKLEAFLPLTQLETTSSDPALWKKVGFNGLWIPPRLMGIMDGGAASKAGLLAGDVVVAVNDEQIYNGQQLVRLIQKLSPEKRANFMIKRDDQLLSILLMPEGVKSVIVSSLTDQDEPYLAGFRNGDLVKTVGGVTIKDQVQYNELFQSGELPESVLWEVERNGKIIALDYLSIIIGTSEQSSSRIGVGVSGFERVKLQYGFFESIAYGWNETCFISRSILTSIFKMIVGEEKVQDNLSGPIAIANIASEQAQRGFDEYIVFLAKISISLFIFNLLPLPVLDGGHLCLYMIEAVRRKRLPDEWVGVLQGIGMFLLLALMLFVTFNDVLRRL